MRTPANNLRLRLTRGWRIKSVTPRLNNFYNYGDHSIANRIRRSIRSYQQRTDYGLIFSHAVIRRYLNRLFQLNVYFYEGAWCEKKFKIKNRKKFRRHRRGKRFKKREYPRKINHKPLFSPLRNYRSPNLMDEQGLNRLFGVRITRRMWVERENFKRNWVWRFRRRARRRRIWRMFLMRQELWFFRFSFLMYGYKKNSNHRLIFHFFESGQMTANSVANYIVGSLTNQFRITSTVYRLIRGLQINQFTSGLMVQASGRFTRRQMSTYEEFKRGRIELNKFYSKTRYAFASVTLKYSLCGIKVWIPPLINVKDLYKARLERRWRRLHKFFRGRQQYVGKIRKWRECQLERYIPRRAKIMKRLIMLNRKMYPLAYYTNKILSKFYRNGENPDVYRKFKKRIHNGMIKWLNRRFWLVSRRRAKKPTLRRFRVRSRNLKYRRRFPRSRHVIKMYRPGWLRVYLNFLKWKKGRRHPFHFKRPRKYYYRRGKRYLRPKRRKYYYYRGCRFIRRKIKRKRIYKRINSNLIKKRFKVKNRNKARKIFITKPKNKKIRRRCRYLAMRYKKISNYIKAPVYRKRKGKIFVRKYAKSKFLRQRMLLFLYQARIKNSGWHELRKYSYYRYKYRRRERQFVIWRQKIKSIRDARKERRKLKAKKEYSRSKAIHPLL